MIFLGISGPKSEAQSVWRTLSFPAFPRTALPHSVADIETLLKLVFGKTIPLLREICELLRFSQVLKFKVSLPRLY